MREAARVLQLEPLLDRKPKALSGGQRQRVAIGRAIVREPKVFLFDEPLSNLDAALRVQMRIELARLHESLNATMIYVTHDQVEAMTLADQIVVLQGGVVEQAGTPLELYHHPEQPVRRGLHRLAQDELPRRRRSRRSTRAAPRSTLPGGGQVTVPVQPGRLKPRRQRDARRPSRAPAPGRCAATSSGEVLVVERLGGETFLYTQLPDQSMIIVQADGEIPTRVHERDRRSRSIAEHLPSVRRRRRAVERAAAPSAGRHEAADRAQGELSEPGRQACIARSTTFPGGSPWSPAAARASASPARRRSARRAPR